MNGVASTAPSMAVEPLTKPMVIDSVSPLAKLLPKVANRAHTLKQGGQAARLKGRPGWTPVAESGPAGFAVVDSRQLSCGNFRNLSWLKLPSSNSGLPNSPAAKRAACRSRRARNGARARCPVARPLASPRR